MKSKFNGYFLKRLICVLTCRFKGKLYRLDVSYKPKLFYGYVEEAKDILFDDIVIFKNRLFCLIEADYPETWEQQIDVDLRVNYFTRYNNGYVGEVEYQYFLNLLDGSDVA